MGGPGIQDRGRARGRLGAADEGTRPGQRLPRLACVVTLCARRGLALLKLLSKSKPPWNPLHPCDRPGRHCSCLRVGDSGDVPCVTL